MTVGQAAYEEWRRLQARSVEWDRLDDAGKERWENIAIAAINQHIADGEPNE